MRVTVRDPFQDIDGTVVGSDLTAQANPQNTLLPLIPLGSRYPEKSKPGLSATDYWLDDTLQV